MLGSDEFKSGTTKSMSYHKDTKLTDTEKRLQSIKLQLYGKDSNHLVHSLEYSQSSKVISTPIINTNTDTNFLKGDLLKILFLAGVSIGVQVSLYLLMTHQILKLNL